MSTTVKYKGYTIATVENTTKTLTTQGKYLEGNITFTDVSSGGGGGGESNYTLVGSAEFTVSSTSTSGSSVGTVPCFQNIKDPKCIIYVRVRDKAGKRDGHFYGSDCFFLNTYAANNNTVAQSNGAKYIHRYSSSYGWNAYSCGSSTGYGVYAYSINSDGNAVNVYRRYNSTYSTKIDGTYTVEVYKLTFPDGVSPFDA